MKQLLLGLLLFSLPAFALNLDVSQGIASVEGDQTILVKNVRMGSLNTRVNIRIVWDGTAFALMDVMQTPGGGGGTGGNYIGVWNTTLQTNCQGNFEDFSVMEFLANGTCVDRGLACTWTDNGGRLEMKWTDSPNYRIEADLINDEINGTITDGSITWCWKGTRAVSLIETLSKIPNYAKVPFRQ